MSIYANITVKGTIKTVKIINRTDAVFLPAIFWEALHFNISSMGISIHPKSSTPDLWLYSDGATPVILLKHLLK